MDTLDLLIRQGKVLYWGMGRFSEEQFANAIRVAEQRKLHRSVAHQTVCNVLNRSMETEGILAEAHRHGAGTLAYGALGQGVLSGKYAAGGVPEGSRAGHPEERRTMYNFNDRALARATTLADVARQEGTSAARLALAWCLRRPEVTTVTVGATTPQQIEENVEACDLRLSASACAAVDDIAGRT